LAILIVTNRADATADYMVRHLEESGVAHYRINTDSFPEDTVEFQVKASGVSAELRSGTSCVPMDAIDAIWWRRPISPPPPPCLVGPDRDFAVNEIEAGLGGVLRTADALWVNHPDANITASYKMLQLYRARACGWRVPQTLLTSRPDAAIKFARSLPELPVVKSIDRVVVESTPTVTRVAYARQLCTEELSNSEAVVGTLTLLQERIHRRREYRVNVIGRELVSTEIAVPQNASGSPIDRRELPDDALSYCAIELSSDAAERCLSLVRSFNLQFAALDLIETPDGELVFLDLNPNGQWAWIELKTGQPIRRMLGELLTGKRGPL
jgi:hypothetical protein